MRRRRPGRFSRAWQRERAERARAEADELDALAYRLAWGRSPVARALFRWRRGEGADTVLPYRGFRAGRSRVRPDDTGYDEPLAPDVPRDSGQDNPWLADVPDHLGGPVIGADDPRS